MRLPLLRHLSIPVLHGCAHLSVPLQLLLYTDGSAASIEQRMAAAPEPMPAQLRDPDLFGPQEQGFLPAIRRSARFHWVGTGKNPFHSLAGHKHALRQKDARKGRIERHFILAVLRLHATDSSVTGPPLGDIRG